jgi:hypothetical protein
VALSLGLHLLLGVWLLWFLGESAIKPPREETARVRFVKAAPPRQRPLSRRALSAPVHRPLVRQQRRQAVPATADRPTAGSAGAGSALGRGGGGMGSGSGPGWGEGLGDGEGGFLAGLSGGAGQGELPSGNAMGPGGGGIGPGLRAGAVGGQRTGADEIDLGLELLGVESMDTGRERALVVIDPKDRRRLKGFLYLASVHSEAIERAELDNSYNLRASMKLVAGSSRQMAERQILQGLADRMTERTQVRVEVLDGLPLDDPRLLQVPFLLLTAIAPFAVTEAEAANLGRYLTSGGFLWIENVAVPQVVGNGYSSDLPALRELIRTAFLQVGCREGKDWSFVLLEMNHPLYHCYYDLAALPMGFYDWPYGYTGPAKHYSPEYLEGIAVGDRLAGIYSQKDYTDYWAGYVEVVRERDEQNNWVGRFIIGGEELKPYDLGVNVLVYALTREGSLAKRLVAAE